MYTAVQKDIKCPVFGTNGLKDEDPILAFTFTQPRPKFFLGGVGGGGVAEGSIRITTVLRNDVTTTAVIHAAEKCQQLRNTSVACRTAQFITLHSTTKNAQL